MAWRDETRTSIRETLTDPIVAKILPRSNLTQAQFETLLVDQLGHAMANKRLTRSEMAQVMRNKRGISRGALNRTLKQARQNISQAIHTILLLGYAGLVESPSIAPFVEASEQLKSQKSQLSSLYGQDVKLFTLTMNSLLNSLEEAFEALYGKNRDT